jgi:hypothetical protein
MRRRDLLSGLAIVTAAGCASTVKQAGESVNAAFALPPVRARPDEIMKITVCTRPFRPQGPRLDVEQIGSRTIVHNYGHGGSGWSLSWGSSSIAVKNALATGQRRVGVVGCGALGLTSAILLQRAGAAVTIYTKELPPDTRSSMATGLFTPESRICFPDQATPAFKERWQQMARTSFNAFTDFLGLPGNPLEWVDEYLLTDVPYEQSEQQARAASTVQFARLASELIPDLLVKPEDLPRGSHPFAPPYARRSAQLMFNLTSYQRLLMDDFLRNEGKIEVTELHSPSDFERLEPKVLINATGFGARALLGDQSLVPIRGQIARLIPQPEVQYSLRYNGISFLPRRDGFVVQQYAPDQHGFNDDSTAVDREESERAVAMIAKACAGMPRNGGAAV